MLPTAGFIPPPVVPLVPVAANGIVATGGLLAGAAAGAKAGAFFGPKGAIAGAVVGGLLLPLLLPEPTAPGTLPGLDPGLNPKESPEPKTSFLDTNGELWTPPGVPTSVGVVHTYELTYQTELEQSDWLKCSDGSLVRPAGTYPYYGNEIQVQSFIGYGIRLMLRTADIIYQCGDALPTTSISLTTLELLQGDGTWKQETLYWTTSTEGVSQSPDWSGTATAGVNVMEFTQDGEPLSLAEIAPKPAPNPRALPVPIEPLIAPAPEPALVPLPEPEPQPQPLEVPSPDSPDAPPITIPQAPPAPPQEVPGTEPEPAPLTVPITPTPIAPPLPVPGVPTVPEPSPDPAIFPAPGPAPLPLPQPSPQPSTDPQPNETPIPLPIETPTVPLPQPSPTPDSTTTTEPDGSPTPQPGPIPIPTPPNQHFPVSGGPPVTNGGTRADISAIAAEVGRIEQKTASIQRGSHLGNFLDFLELLPLWADFLKGDIPGTTYSLQGVCETVEDGADQPVADFPVAKGKNLAAVINRLDTIDQMLQQHLAWKTPICRERPRLEGDWRTISFISDEISPTGDTPIRKRFRYRSISGLDLGAVIEHWRSFAWQAGPVCVQHAGASWGTPQVWAASIDEGKRVIRHAAGEAGIDPDQDGRWIISGSNSARVGLPGTMRVNRRGGYYWITARDGSEGRPVVGSVGLDP